MEEKETVREPYRMVLEGGQAELVEKKSRFIANVRPVESEAEAVAFIDEMKKKYWDARHNCSAFVIGTKAELTRCSDDGEPSGTAGRPMLNVLLHCGIGEIAVVVTRYFGGTLLGTGGLVRAYQDLVKLGLENLPVKEKVPATRCTLTFEPRFLGKFQRLMEDAGAAVLSKDFMGDVTFTLEVPDAAVERLGRAISEASAGRAALKAE